VVSGSHGLSMVVAGLALLVFLLSYVGTRQLASLDSKLVLIDHPNERSLHTAPTPRTGGLAILGGWIAGLLLAQAAAWTGRPMWDETAQGGIGSWSWVVGLVLLLGAVSLWDDRKGLSPAVRLILHGLAAAGAVWGAGLVVEVVPVPFMGDLRLGPLATPLTLLGLMWMANLYNFMDGMDGFAGGMSVLGFGMVGYLAWRGGAQQLALVALLVAGAAGGFLIFNLPPARIFMGDVGSVSLGFLAGTLAILGVRDRVFDIWVPFMIFSPFIADATVTLVRRLLHGAKVWQAHREHFYQRLVLAGWGHRKALIAEYYLMLASGAVTMLYVHEAEPVRAIILAGGLVAYVTLAWLVRAVELSAGKRRAEA